MHREFWSEDPGKVAEFYKSVFDSLFEDPDGRLVGMWKQLAQTGE